MRSLGLLSLAFWAIHAGNHLFFLHTGHDLLWVCNLAPILLAIGCFMPNPEMARRHCSVAVCWLSYGGPIWLLDIATGANMIATSVFVHVGCLVLGILAVRRVGWPRGAWAVALITSLFPLGLARLVTPPRANVMLAFRVHDGWEKYFSSHGVYLLVMIAGSGVVFFAVETIARRFLAVSSAAP